MLVASFTAPKKCICWMYNKCKPQPDTTLASFPPHLCLSPPPPPQLNNTALWKMPPAIRYRACCCTVCLKVSYRLGKYPVQTMTADHRCRRKKTNMRCERIDQSIEIWNGGCTASNTPSDTILTFTSLIVSTTIRCKHRYHHQRTLIGPRRINKDGPDNKAPWLLDATMVVLSLGDRWRAEREFERKSICWYRLTLPFGSSVPPSLVVPLVWFLLGRRKKTQGENEKAEIFWLTACQRDPRYFLKRKGWVFSFFVFFDKKKLKRYVCPRPAAKTSKNKLGADNGWR